MTALTIFACFAAIFLILLIVPPTQVVGRRRAGGAQRLAHGRRGRLPVRVHAVVLAVPLGRTLFEITALPWWQYFVLLGLAFVWSQLCLLVWKTHLLDRWLGTAEDPGNVCAQGRRPRTTRARERRGRLSAPERRGLARREPGRALAQTSPADGHIGASGHSPQAGRRAWQMRRPCRTKSTCTA